MKHLKAKRHIGWNIVSIVSKLATVVEGNQKAPFSIAATSRFSGGRYSFRSLRGKYIIFFQRIIWDIRIISKNRPFHFHTHTHTHERVGLCVCVCIYVLELEYLILISLYNSMAQIFLLCPLCQENHCSKFWGYLASNTDCSEGRKYAVNSAVSLSLSLSLSVNSPLAVCVCVIYTKFAKEKSRVLKCTRTTQTLCCFSQRLCYDNFVVWN